MFILNPYTAKPNTIIGGVGSVITTKSALATKLGISESIIRNFEVVGSDVYCRITSDYSISANTFNSDGSITSYLDFDGKCTLINQDAFNNSINLSEVIFPNVTSLNARAFQYAGLKSISLPNCVFVGGNAISYLPDLEEIYLQKAVTFLNYAVRNNAKLHTFHAESLDSFSAIGVLRNNPLLSNVLIKGEGTIDVSDTFWNCTSLPEIDFFFTGNIGGRNFNNNPQATYVNLPYATSISGLNFNGLTNCATIDLPSVTNIDKNNVFVGLSNCVRISAKQWKTSDDASIVGGLFTGLKTGCLIQVQEDLATANAGAADAALVWAKANRSAVVEFYDDSGNYVSTL